MTNVREPYRRGPAWLLALGATSTDRRSRAIELTRSELDTRMLMCSHLKHFCLST